MISDIPDAERLKLENRIKAILQDERIPLKLTSSITITSKPLETLKISFSFICKKTNCSPSMIYWLNLIAIKLDADLRSFELDFEIKKYACRVQFYF